MEMDSAIVACIDQETASIRDAVDNSEGAILGVQTIVGRDMARFVAQDCLTRAGNFPDEFDSTARYQTLLAHLYAWVKAST